MLSLKLQPRVLADQAEEYVPTLAEISKDLMPGAGFAFALHHFAGMDVVGVLSSANCGFGAGWTDNWDDTELVVRLLDFASAG